MQRRPPTDPLPRGLVWTLLPRGAHPRGAPNFEYRYRTPAFPEGISPLLVTGLAREEQVGLAEHWFRLNFVPDDLDGPMFTIGVSAVGGTDGIAPNRATAASYLAEEFGEIASASVLDAVAARLQLESVWWIPSPPESTASDGRDLAAAARVCLERVQADLDHIGPGHNQGPPLDPSIAAEIREQVRLGLEAVAAGDQGKPIASSAASGLTKLVVTVTSGFAQGVAKKAGEDAEPFIKHGLAVLLDHMLQAASALLHWIASIPPGPLL